MMCGLMKGGMVVTGLLRASLNGSRLGNTDYEQISGRKFKMLVMKVYGGGEQP
jgi:hypothetical protein